MTNEEIIEKIIDELQKIAFADFSAISSAFDTAEGSDFANKIAEFESHLPAVSQIKSVKDGVEIKFYDKLKALELLGKYVKGQSADGESGDFDNLIEVLKLRSSDIWKGGDTD